MAGALPDLRVRRIEHARDVGDALRRMLAGSTLHAVRVDATTWRIEPLAPTRRSRKLIPRPPPELAAGDIIVTASKRDERLSDLARLDQHRRRAGAGAAGGTARAGRCDGDDRWRVFDQSRSRP
ncbi:hypothetical protein QP185_22280 [Sphingomonas aerolata]|uniref:hypothetical protein n=1 Tax=Sphingomonas aerolata TaxID=185951 RepID=UPI002FE1B79C